MILVIAGVMVTMVMVIMRSAPAECTRLAERTGFEPAGLAAGRFKATTGDRVRVARTAYPPMSGWLFGVEREGR